MRRTATAAIILTSGLFFSACSSAGDDEATDPGASSSSAAPSTQATPTDASTDPETSTDTAGSDDVAPETIKGLALTAADFPAPYTFTELPPGALESVGKAIGGAIAGATYVPAACGNATQASTGADLSQAGVAIGADQASGTSVTSVLSPVVEPVADLEELAKTCATFSFSLAGPDGAPLKGDATLELLPAPEVDADKAQAVKTSVTVSVGGQQQVVDTVVYEAVLRGVSVVSSSTGLKGSGDGTAALQDLLVAGLDKVRSAP